MEMMNCLQRRPNICTDRNMYLILLRNLHIPALTAWGRHCPIIKQVSEAENHVNPVSLEALFWKT